MFQALYSGIKGTQLALVHEVDEEATVKVIHLMLHHAGKPSSADKRVWLAVDILKIDLHRIGPQDIPPDVGKRQAAFLAKDLFPGQHFHHWIHQGHRHDQINRLPEAIKLVIELFIRQVGNIHDKNHKGPVDLLGGQADALLGIHGLNHVRDEIAEFFIERLNLLARLTEHRLSILCHAQLHADYLTACTHFHVQSNRGVPMASTPQKPPSRKRRPAWQLASLTMVNLFLAFAALALGMCIPSTFRSVSPLVLEAAGKDTPTLLDQAESQLQAGRPGLASPLMQAWSQTTRQAIPSGMSTQEQVLLEERPLYRWSGGPAPFYEQFLRQAPFLREDEPAVIPTLLPGANRRELAAFLSESPSRNVQLILKTRSLGGWQRFYPVYSTSGQPLEATILAAALLEQSSAIADGIRVPLLAATEKALEGDLPAIAELESFNISILTLGRRANWLQLQELLRQLEDREQLLMVAQSIQEDPDRLPVVISAILNLRSPDKLVHYLARHKERGWEGLQVALGMGQGALEALLQFDKPVYDPPAIWNALPESIRQSQNAFKGFAETWPVMAIGARALSFALCGFFLVAILRILIFKGQPRPDHQRRVLVNLDSLVGGVLVMMLVWILIEPGLLDFRPNEEGTLQIQLARIVPESLDSQPSTESTTMIDQVTILILLLFFVIQLLVFIFCLLKITEVKRQPHAAEVKLHLLENEENLFDLGLYVGLGGTVASLILVVLNIVDASLMAAYASTLFGIIFVALLKVGFLRPYRRVLILQKNNSLPQK